MSPKGPVLTSHRLIRAIIYTNIAFFLISLVIGWDKGTMNLNPFTALQPSNESLFFLGASGTIPIDRYQVWWSLLTANWLHGGLLHIVFNMIAFSQLAPLVTREYGPYRMFIIYTITGTAGFYISYLAGIRFTIGASGAVCGLIGAALYFGKSRGGMWGQAIYKHTMGWILGLALFGLLVPGINNWGHGGGLLAGIFTGWLLGYNDRVREHLIHKVAGIAFMGITIAVLCFSVVMGIILSL